MTELKGLDDPAALEPNEQEPAVVAESGSDQ